MSLIDALNWRYAVKKFDATKKIDDKTWNALEDSLVLTPSSYGLQPWKFIVITNKEVMQKLTPVSWGQKQVEDCSHMVVMAVKEKLDENYIAHFIDTIASVRGVEASSLEGYKKMMVGGLSKMGQEWASRQAYIALGNFMTSCAVLGVDTCPMEGIDPVKYDEILGLNGTGFKTVVACPAGYRAQDDGYVHAKKVRFPNREMITHIK